MSEISRRQALRALGATALGCTASGWMPALAREIAENSPRRHFVLLWMTGGPSQIDTFDLKHSHANGGQFKEIETSVPGLKISEHLPKLATMADRLAVVRSLSTKEGDHARATFLMRTGHRPGEPVRYPPISALLSKELGSSEAEIPNYVTIGPQVPFNPLAFGPGFLGPRFAPLAVEERSAGPQPNGSQALVELGVADLRGAAQTADRIGLWRELQDGFLTSHRSASPLAHDTVYQRAMRMMQGEVAKAFDLSAEPAATRESYGRGGFGQACLMARRLIEAGVPCIEISLGSFGNNQVAWDTHQNNFQAVRSLSQLLDTGWSRLMSELNERGLLTATTILWMGEFGRTPVINQNAGRDHYPAAWTAVLAGGGIRGGQAFGRTSDDGMTVEDGKVDVGDLLATVCRAVGVDPSTQNTAEMGRPIRIAEGTPIDAVLA